MPGMRVADLGCGPGKTTFYLNKLVQPNGSAVGVDFSTNRIDHAKNHYLSKGIEFIIGDIRCPLDHLGFFDFIWVRFVLEHYRSNSFDIVNNISSLLKPGGILCLIDLDYNCLSHYGMPERLMSAVHSLISIAEKNMNFDPYAGRKLYAHLYDLGYNKIDMKVTSHHLIFGDLKEVDDYNWSKKVETTGIESGYSFEEYQNGYTDFVDEFKSAFADPRRFTYTPIIWAKGRKPKI
jgi:SAM-dependent methyltransferase